ncbi:DNA primase [Rhodococcus hoagii]|nr:DNA primase [Prescottella equi]
MPNAALSHARPSTGADGAGQGRIDNASIEQVRNATDIGELISHYTLVKRSGAGHMALCPFHAEKSPSLHISANGMWHCFGCGVGGDAIAFVQQIETLSFVEAVEHLADLANITVTYSGGQAPSPAVRTQRSSMTQALSMAAEFYRQSLGQPGAQAAQSFLRGRNFTGRDALDFGVGYAPDSWDSLTRTLRRQGVDDRTLVASGLAIEGHRGLYDRFRNRVIWPISGATGGVIGFGARRLDDADKGGKYINTPETELYRKSTVLYGLDTARRAIAASASAVVVEGYTDVMACRLAGIDTAVATCGTAFTAGHLTKLRRLLACDTPGMGGTITFLFDDDAAGHNAARSAFDIVVGEPLAAFVCFTSDGNDPCDVRLTAGNEALAAKLQDRRPLTSFVLSRVIDEHDQSTPEGRAQTVDAVREVIGRLPNPLLREEYATVAATWIGGVEPARLIPRPVRAVADTAAEPSSQPLTMPHRIEREALKALLQQPVVAATWLEHLAADMFTLADHQAQADAILAADRAELEELPDPTPWQDRVFAAAGHTTVRSLLLPLCIEPVHADIDAVVEHAHDVLSRVTLSALERQRTELTARLGRLAPADRDSAGSLLTQLAGIDEACHHIHRHRTPPNAA